MLRNSFYWGTTKWAWDLAGGSNTNGNKVIHTCTSRGTTIERFRHPGDHLVKCRDPAALANLEADPREGRRSVETFATIV